MSVPGGESVCMCVCVCVCVCVSSQAAGYICVHMQLPDDQCFDLLVSAYAMLQLSLHCSLACSLHCMCPVLTMNQGLDD